MNDNKKDGRLIPWAKELSFVHLVTAGVLALLYTLHGQLGFGMPAYADPLADFHGAFLLMVSFGWPVSIAITAVIIYRRGGV